MKGLLERLCSSRFVKSTSAQSEPAFFSTTFASQTADRSLQVAWATRAMQVGASRMPANDGVQLLQALWARDKYMAHLHGNAVIRMEPFFEFVHVDGNQDVIQQDEYGNFMLVLLAGTIAVDRLQPWGEQLRLAEACPGEILGEMSLLDGGIRVSACTTLTECDIAVLSAQGMDAMMAKDAQLAASLIAFLAHKLSLRMRAVSARLSEHQH